MLSFDCYILLKKQQQPLSHKHRLFILAYANCYLFLFQPHVKVNLCIKVHFVI